MRCQTVALLVGLTAFFSAPGPAALAADPAAEVVHTLVLGDARVVSLCFLDGDTVLFGAGRTGHLAWWDVRTGKVLRTDRLKTESDVIVMAPDGKTLLSPGPGKAGGSAAVVLDAGSLAERFRVEGLNPGVGSAAFSRDGRAVAVGGLAGEISVWDTKRGSRSARPTVARPGRRARDWLALSPDGGTLYTLSEDHMLRVWDAVFDLPMWEARLPRRGIPIAAAAPGGELFGVVAPQSDAPTAPGVVHFWEGNTGLARGTLLAGPEHLTPIVLGPADTWLLTLSGGEERVLGTDLRTGWTGVLLRLPKYRANTAAVSADGRLLAVGDQVGGVTVWRVTPAREAVRAASPAQLDTYWEELGSKSPEKAAAAVAGLVTRPDQAVPFLRERGRSAPAFDAKAVRERIARLDADQPRTRTKAVDDLVAGGADVRTALRAAYVARGMTEEQRRLLKAAAGRLTRPDWSEGGLRRLRVVEVLSGIRTAQARALLEEIAAGDEFDPAVAAARAAVSRRRD